MIFVNVFEIFYGSDILSMLFNSFCFCGVMFCVQKLVFGRAKL